MSFLQIFLHTTNREETIKVLSRAFAEILTHLSEGQHKKKYSLDDLEIHDILSQRCEHVDSCFVNFSVMDVIKIRKLFCYCESGVNGVRLNNEFEVYAKLIPYLRSRVCEKKGIFQMLVNIN